MEWQCWKSNNMIIILRNLDLQYAVLIGVDLRGADLRGSILTYADLSGANLTGASWP